MHGASWEWFQTQKSVVRSGLEDKRANPKICREYIIGQKKLNKNHFRGRDLVYIIAHISLDNKSGHLVIIRRKVFLRLTTHLNPYIGGRYSIRLILIMLMHAHAGRKIMKISLQPNGHFSETPLF